MSDIPELVRCPPVLICGFARPDTLALVFARVREIKPSHLYLWLNCPRKERPDEVSRNQQCREVFAGVDWPCDVHRRYSDVYLDVRDSLEGAFNWFFENVEQGIILEDDCVPDPTFFRFCGELLERYKNDTRVGMIAGCDEHFHVKETDYFGDSYYFDRFSSIWGWATWRRAWKLHDPKLSYWPEFRKHFGLMEGYYRKKYAVRNRMLYTDQLHMRTAGTWDGCWATTMYKENWLCIHPVVNLMTNYGCGKSSRDSSIGNRRFWQKPRKDPWDRRPTEPMQFPLQHPITMIPNIESEHWRFLDSGVIMPWYKRLYYRVRHNIGIVVKPFLKFC